MEDILNGKIKRKELSKWLDEVNNKLNKVRLISLDEIRDKFERKREERLKEDRRRIFGDLKP